MTDALATLLILCGACAGGLFGYVFGLLKALGKITDQQVEIKKQDARIDKLIGLVWERREEAKQDDQSTENEPQDGSQAGIRARTRTSEKGKNDDQQQHDPRAVHGVAGSTRGLPRVDTPDS